MVHKDDRPHGCNLCTKHFKSSAQLNQHVKFIHTKTTKEFICTECNKAYFTKQHLTRHQTTHKNDGEGFPECYFCHKKLSQSCNLVEHLRIHTQEKPFICKENFCKYSCTHLYSLKNHQRRFHSSTSFQINGRIWECYFCFKSYRQFGDLVIHMRRHTKEVPFKCSFCKKKYIGRQALTYHIATHTNETPFSCFECDKEFKTSCQLKGHMSTHTKEQRYFCQFCSYASYFKRDFNTHLLKRHNASM